MREEMKQRLAAFLCEIYEAGRASIDMELPEKEMVTKRDPAWLDAFAREHKEIFEDPDAETEHDWPVWEAKADEILRLLVSM